MYLCYTALIVATLLTAMGPHTDACSGASSWSQIQQGLPSRLLCFVGVFVMAKHDDPVLLLNVILA